MRSLPNDELAEGLHRGIIGSGAAVVESDCCHAAQIPAAQPWVTERLMTKGLMTRYLEPGSPFSWPDQMS